MEGLFVFSLEVKLIYLKNDDCHVADISGFPPPLSSE